MSLEEQLRMAVDRKAATPLHLQIQRELEAMLRRGELRPGDHLAGEMELARAIGVNHQTVRKALGALALQGTLERKRKSGTFVRDAGGARSASVGFFYFREAVEYMGKVAEDLQEFLGASGVDLKVVGYELDYFGHHDLCGEVRSKGLAAAIVVTVPTEACRANLLRLEAAGFPHVRFDNVFFDDELSSPLVRVNHAEAARRMFERLWADGHRNIGIVVNRHDDFPAQAYRGFYADKPWRREEWLASVEYSGPSAGWKLRPGALIARGYLELNPDVTAVVPQSPLLCVDFLRQAAAMGKRIPGDLSVACLRDAEYLEMASPPVTANRRPWREMAKAAADKALDAIVHWPPPEAGRLAVVEEILVERGSVGPASR